MQGVQHTLEAKTLTVHPVEWKGLCFDGAFLEEASLCFLRSLFELRQAFERRLRTLYVEPEWGLVSGLLLGSRAGLMPELSDAFRQAGLMHLVAVSGYNISLVIAAFCAFFVFLPFRQRLFWSGLGVLCFVFLVGASASVVRAAIMGSLALFSQFTGRRSAALFGLLWTAIFMGFWNPYRLVYDIGFQLSFMATLGLLIFNPLLKKSVEASFCAAPFLRLPPTIQEAALLSVSAQVFTFPITAFYFQTFSWVTIFANIAVAPLLPLAMAFSGLSILFPPASVLSFLVLRLLEQVAFFFAALPGASVQLPFSQQALWATYAGLGIWICLSYKSILLRAFRR
jgi:competence protein ComEC